MKLKATYMKFMCGSRVLFNGSYIKSENFKNIVRKKNIFLKKWEIIVTTQFLSLNIN